MSVRIIIASVVSAIVMFIWGFVFWTQLAMSLSPWKTIPARGEDSVVAALRSGLAEDGVYVRPWVDTSEGDQPGLQKDFEQQQSNGPFVRIYYRHKGIQPIEMDQTMAYGFVHMLFSSMLASILVALTAKSCNFFRRVGLVVGMGLLAAVWVEGSNLVWWHQPRDHVLFVSMYHVGAWLLASLIIGAIVTRPKERAVDAVVLGDAA